MIELIAESMGAFGGALQVAAGVLALLLVLAQLSRCNRDDDDHDSSGR